MFHLLLPILPAVALGYYLVVLIIELIIIAAIILLIIGIIQIIRYKIAKKKGKVKKGTKISAIICTILGGIVVVPLMIIAVISAVIRADEAREQEMAFEAFPDKIMLDDREWVRRGFDYHGRRLILTNETGGISRINKSRGEVVSTIIDGSLDKNNKPAHYDLVKVPSDSGYDIFYVDKYGVYVYEDELGDIVDYYMNKEGLAVSRIRLGGDTQNKELDSEQCTDIARIIRKYSDIDVLEQYENDEVHNEMKYTVEVGSKDGLFWVVSTVIVADEGVFRVHTWNSDGSFTGWTVSDPTEAELLKSIGK